MSDVVDNADIDLSNVDIGQPVIDNQTPLCRTGQVEVKATNSGHRRLVIPLVLEEPATSTTGKALNVGFTTTVGFLIDPKGGLTQERINEELAKFQVAVLKLDKPTTFRMSDLSPYQGQLVRPKLVAQKNDPSRQDVKAWLKAAS